MREFRDGYMKENYPAHIDTYYKIAPVIVEKIKADADKENILEDLFEKIKIAVNCVTTKHYDVAQALYTEEIIKLKKRYNLN